MKFVAEFDGVWASTSLPHVSYEDTRSVFEKIHQSLRPKGIFYASYKYGQGKIIVGDRESYNMTENMLPCYFRGLFEMIDIWQAIAHPTNTQQDYNWLNILVKKI